MRKIKIRRFPVKIGSRRELVVRVDNLKSFLNQRINDWKSSIAESKKEGTVHRTTELIALKKEDEFLKGIFTEDIFPSEEVP